MAGLAFTIVYGNTRSQSCRIGHQRYYRRRYIQRFRNVQIQCRRIYLRRFGKIKIRSAHIPRIISLHRTQRNGRNIFCIIHRIDQALSVIADLYAFLLCAVQCHTFCSVRSKSVLVVGCVIIIVYAAEAPVNKPAVSDDKIVAPVARSSAVAPVFTVTALPLVQPVGSASGVSPAAVTATEFNATLLMV